MTDAISLFFADAVTIGDLAPLDCYKKKHSPNYLIVIQKKQLFPRLQVLVKQF